MGILRAVLALLSLAACDGLVVGTPDLMRLRGGKAAAAPSIFPGLESFSGAGTSGTIGGIMGFSAGKAAK